MGAVLACGGKRPVQGPAPAAPLPTGGLAGQQVSVLPLTLVAAEEELHWDTSLADRRAALARADSVIEALLRARAPEVNWLFPDDLRRAARRAPSVAHNPDQMGTAMLRAENISVVPDPLRSELRTLVLEEAAGTALQQLLVQGRDPEAAVRVVARAVAAFNQDDLSIKRPHPLVEQFDDGIAVVA